MLLVVGLGNRAEGISLGCRIEPALRVMQESGQDKEARSGWVLCPGMSSEAVLSCCCLEEGRKVTGQSVAVTE